MVRGSRRTHSKPSQKHSTRQRDDSRNYLIELRMGTLRPIVGETVDHIKYKFRLGNESPETPHLSLYGSFKIKSGHRIEDVMTIIKSTADNYSTLPYWIDGWDYKQGNGGMVVAFKILPSQELKNFTVDMVRKLWTVTKPRNAFDYHPENAWFHITVAFRLNNQKFSSIKNYIENDNILHEPIKSPKISLCSKIKNFLNISKINTPNQYFSSIDVSSPNKIRSLHMPVDGLRVTIIEGNKIKYEYDLLTKRWFQRIDALKASSWQKTLQYYRFIHKYELLKNCYLNGNSKLFTISDLHLGHANIIKYCCRPFLYSQVDEMDRILINNWNNTVRSHDWVYHVGDFTFRDRHPNQYISLLNGQKKFIRGNHDRYIENAFNALSIKVDELDLLFLHNPKDKPLDYDGWTIHGHVHNNKLKQYPFFNPDNKMINVSAEVISYRPIPVSTLVDLIRNRNEPLYYLK